MGFHESKTVGFIIRKKTRALGHPPIVRSVYDCYSIQTQYTEKSFPCPHISSHIMVLPWATLWTLTIYT